MRKVRLALVLVTVLAAGFPVARLCAASEWELQTVDARWVRHPNPSIALDANGWPRISYLAMLGEFDEDWCLGYAAWNGTSWDLELVDSRAGVGNSLQLDAAGHPHISYADFHGGIKYAAWNGASWDIQVVDSVKGQTCLDLDSGGQPHMTYYDEGNADLKYAAWNGANWDIEVVDGEGDVGRSNALALDSSDRPHIAYRDYTNGQLKYAKWNGSAWELRVVDSEDANTGLCRSPALDRQDCPRISYGRDDGRAL
jgi:hypothetical protein